MAFKCHGRVAGLNFTEYEGDAAEITDESRRGGGQTGGTIRVKYRCQRLSEQLIVKCRIPQQMRKTLGPILMV